MDNETYWNGDRLFRGRCFAEHGSRSTIRLKSDSKMGRVGVYTQFHNLLRPLVMMKPLPNEATDRCQEGMTSDAWFFSTISKYLHCRLNGLITVSNYLLVWASCIMVEFAKYRAWISRIVRFFIGRKAKTRCFIPDHRSKRGIESLSPSCLNTFSRARGVSTSGIFYLGEKEGGANKRLSESGRSFRAIASRPRISRVSCKTRR